MLGKTIVTRIYIPLDRNVAEFPFTIQQLKSPECTELPPPAAITMSSSTAHHSTPMFKAPEPYKTISKLGEGAFSDVYRVENTQTHKPYAMKKFKKLFQNARDVESLREIQALRRLNPHPNIIVLENVVLYVSFVLATYRERKNTEQHTQQISYRSKRLDMEQYILIITSAEIASASHL